MCSICDGTTYEEALEDLHECIDRYGWAVQGVEARRAWAYTIGLAERFDHPELVLAGVPWQASLPVLNALGTMVATGEVLEPGRVPVLVGEVELAVGAVHPVHLANGLIGMWDAHYEAYPPSPRRSVVQVLPLPGRRLPLDHPHTTLE